MALSRDAILNAVDIKTKTVAVPEWGGDVIVGTMSGTARDEWEQSLIQRKGNKTEPNLQNIRARLVMATAIDEEGKRLFSESDIVALGKKSSAALERVCKVAQALNGIGEAELEDLQGN
jgi:hypothetical protein